MPASRTRTLPTLALAVLLGSGLVGVGSAGTAEAACLTGTYPPADCSALAVTDSSVQQSQPFTASVRGFEPASPVAFYVRSAPRYLGTVEASAAGSAATTLTMPIDLPAGEHHLLAIGTGPDGQARTVSIPITMLAGTYQAPATVPSPSGAPALPSQRALAGSGSAVPVAVAGNAPTARTGGLPMTGLALGGYLTVGLGSLLAGVAAVRLGRSNLRRRTGDV